MGAKNVIYVELGVNEKRISNLKMRAVIKSSALRKLFLWEILKHFAKRGILFYEKIEFYRSKFMLF